MTKTEQVHHCQTIPISRWGDHQFPPARGPADTRPEHQQWAAFIETMHEQRPADVRAVGIRHLERGDSKRYGAHAKAYVFDPAAP